MVGRPGNETIELYRSTCEGEGGGRRRREKEEGEGGGRRRREEKRPLEKGMQEGERNEEMVEGMNVSFGQQFNQMCKVQ